MTKTIEKNTKEVQVFDLGILGDLDATAVAEKIRKKEFTSIEAVACAIERAKVTHSKLNAVVNDRYEAALHDASGSHIGAFAGVPTFIKDLNDVEGLPTLKGSSSFRIKPAKKNDQIVEEFLSAGVVILGKSATSEFGLLPCGETLQHGETRNPWNTEYSTGGSSAGAAALVAAGVVPFAHGSDGGGSIRIPSSCCGLVGLKPSRGRNITSLTAHPVLPVNLAEDGVLTRTVRDTANFIAALEEHYSNPKLPAIGHVTGPSKKRLRIALFTDAPLGSESQESVKDAVLSAGKLCEDLGHSVEYIRNPFSHGISRDFIMYYSYMTFMSMIGELKDHGLGYNHLKASKFTKQLGAVFPLISLFAPFAFRRLARHNEYYESQFEKYDVLLSPVLSHPAPKLGYFGTEEGSIDVLLRLSSYVNFTPTQNIAGATAVSLPLGMSREGIPIGVQFAGRSGDERKLLEMAFEIEEAGVFIPHL